jgi:hypothetical protein
MSSASSSTDSSASSRVRRCYSWCSMPDWIFTATVSLMVIFLIASAAPATQWTTVQLSATENNSPLQIKYTFSLRDVAIQNGGSANPSKITLDQLDARNGVESNCVSAARNTGNLTIAVLVVHIVLLGLYVWKKGDIIGEIAFQVCELGWFNEIVRNRMRLGISLLFFFAVLLQIIAVGSFNNSTCLSLLTSKQNNNLVYTSSQVGNS